PSSDLQIVFDECLATGAVITGKRTGDFAGYWDGDHHNGVPIFVPTHQAPAENPVERGHYAIEMQLRPVLLGQGRRLFDDLPPEHIELDLVRALQAPATLHLRYEVRPAWPGPSRLGGGERA